MTRLSGKTAVITGGATGIGLAAAKRFIEEGAFVFIFGRRQGSARRRCGRTRAQRPRGEGLGLRSGRSRPALYAKVKAERGTLDIVFANAGVGKPACKLGEDHCRAHRRNLRHQREGDDLHGPEGASADGQGRFDHPDRIERRHHGCPGNERLQREQGGSSQPRAELGRRISRAPASGSMCCRPGRRRPSSRRKRSATRASRPTAR